MTTNYVIKISKPGYSTHDDVNKQNYIFRSDLVSMAQKSVIHPTITTHSVFLGYGDPMFGSPALYDGEGNATIAHNFGYIPKFIVFVTRYYGDYSLVPWYSTVDDTSKPEPYETFTVEVDENYIYLTATACNYEFVSGVGFSSQSAIITTYTFDVVLFMERIGVGMTPSPTKVTYVEAKGKIV